MSLIDNSGWVEITDPKTTVARDGDVIAKEGISLDDVEAQAQTSCCAPMYFKKEGMLVKLDTWGTPTIPKYIEYMRYYCQKEAGSTTGVTLKCWRRTTSKPKVKKSKFHSKPSPLP